MKYTIITLAMIAGQSYAQTSYQYDVSEDNEGNMTYKHTLTEFRGKLGIQASSSGIDTGIGSFRLNKIQVITNKLELGPITLNGRFGIGEVSNKNFLAVDTETSIKLTDKIKVEGSASTDVVESGPALLNNTNMRTLTAGGLYEGKNYGVVTGRLYTSFSDNNSRTGYYGKVWFSPFEGVNTYIRVKSYESKFTTPDYFSPLHYDLKGIGITLRKAFGDARLFGSVERARTKTGSTAFANTWQFRAEKNFNNVRVSVGTGKDYSNSNYFYKYSDLRLSVTF